MPRTAACPTSGAGNRIHLNHTNRLLWDGDAARAIEARGFRVARDGEAFPL